jgi:hypothetical protein
MSCRSSLIWIAKRQEKGNHVATASDGGHPETMRNPRFS